MKNTLEIIRKCLLTLLITITIVSFVLVLSSENMSVRWIIAFIAAFAVFLMLSIYTYDARIIYRRFAPILVCVGSVVFMLFSPVLKISDYLYDRFYRCYKIRKMSGSFSNCYVHVQKVYDEYSNYEVND